MRLVLGIVMGVLLGSILFEDRWHRPVTPDAVTSVAPVVHEAPPVAPDLPEVTPIVITQAVDISPPSPSFQVAWKTFRSETSARGFARKLTDQLQRPFEVVREGPGRYQVRFMYMTEEERSNVLSSIEFMTGYRMASGS